MHSAGNEKSTDAFRFRKGLLPEGEIRTLTALLFWVVLPRLLLAPSPDPSRDAESSRLLPYPTALPQMLPNDPVAPKSSEEPLRGRMDGNDGRELFLLCLLFADEECLASAAVVVVAWAAVVVVAGVAGTAASSVESLFV